MAVDVTTVIQATLAPIFLVSGAAIFLNFTQARLFRVMDRLRAIGKDLSHGTAASGGREPARDQQGRHVRRAVILRNAIFFGVLVIAFTIVTTLLLLLSGLGIDASVFAIGTFAAGLISFLVALLLVVSDAFISVATAREIAEEFEARRA